MNKLKLEKSNPGNFSKDKPYVEIAKGFNNGIIEVSETQIKITLKNGKFFRSSLSKTEEDFMTITHQGEYEDGTPFRLIRPHGVTLEISKLQGENESLVFAGLSGDGYAVHYELVDMNSPDTEVFEENRDTEFTKAIESKAEILVGTADSLHSFNPNMARDHIKRCLTLIRENQLEFLKFEHIQNMIYGYILAIRLGLISEDSAQGELNNLNLTFDSNNHVRYENGRKITSQSTDENGNNFFKRQVVIQPNYELKEGYLVTVYNTEGLHPFLGTNVQMAPKRMKVIEKTHNKIVLRGFGFDQHGGNFSDYGISVHLSDNELDHLTLHMLDRNVDIKYFS